MNAIWTVNAILNAIWTEKITSFRLDKPADCGYPLSMALPRIIVSSEPTVYHVITRVSRGEFLFGDLEKERMRKMIWQMADFCGVEVLTYAVMSNHLHLVVRVPVKEECDAVVENAEVLRRFVVLYGAQSMREAAAILALGAEAEWATFRGKYLPLMHDLSWFVRLLKQRFARWYNAFHKTFGTLWAERFTSVIVEGTGDALLAVCAYVDLNPVRAKLVDDPKDYRYSAYGEAVGGKALARRGLESAMGGKRGDWKAAQARYRLILYSAGTVPKVKNGNKQGKISHNAAEAVMKAKGELSWAVALTSRVRYFARGGILGTGGYVDRIFEMKREHFPAARKDGARKMRGGIWGEMRSLRQLRGGVSSVS